MLNLRRSLSCRLDCACGRPAFQPDAAPLPSVRGPLSMPFSIEMFASVASTALQDPLWYSAAVRCQNFPDFLLYRERVGHGAPVSAPVGAPVGALDAASARSFSLDALLNI